MPRVIEVFVRDEIAADLEILARREGHKRDVYAGYVLALWVGEHGDLRDPRGNVAPGPESGT